MKRNPFITGTLSLALTATLLAAQSEEEVIELEETALKSEETETPEEERIASESSAGSKFEIPIAETPRSISVVTEQQMEDRGVKTVEEALFYTPGVYAGAYGVDTRGDWAKVRGVAPQNYRDGLKSMFGFYNNTRPHPYTLESVEVVKGPASVLYGQSSPGGILNVETKTPLAARLRQVKAEYGTDNWKQIGFDVNEVLDPEGKFLFRFVGIARDADTMVDHVQDDALVFTPSFKWQPTEDTAFTLLANYQENDSGPSTQFLPLEGTMLPGRRIPPSTFIGEPGWDTYDTEQASLTGLFEHRINDTWSLETKARYTESEADYRAHWVAYTPVPTINPDGTVTRTIYESDHTADVFVGDFRLKSEFGTGVVDHKLAFGTDYQHALTENDVYYGFADGGDINIYDPTYGNRSPVGPQSGPEITTTQLGFYANDHVTLDRWILSLGARGDRATSKTEGADSAQKDNSIVGDAGLMYRFYNGVSPYASYAESFEPIAGMDANGDPFDPKEGRQYEVGVKYQPIDWSSLFTLAAFDIKEENRPTAAPGGSGQVQTGEAQIQGIEFSSQTNWEDFYLQLGYTYLDTEVTESNDGNEGNNLPSVPDHLASAWVTYKPSFGFRAGFGARYAGNTWDGTDTHETPSYTVFDAMIGYDFGRFDVALNATNLFDKEYVTSSESSTGYYGAPRRVILSARYNF